jgi:hypothetical protein
VVDTGVSNQTAGLNDPDRFTVYMRTLNDLQYLPLPAREQLISGNHSPDPKTLYAAAMKYLAYEDKRPSSFARDLDNKDTENLRQVVGAIRAGSSPADALTLATRLVKQTPVEKLATQQQGEIVARTVKLGGANDYVRQLGQQTLSWAGRTGLFGTPGVPQEASPTQREEQARKDKTGAPLLEPAMPAIPFQLENQLEVELRKALIVTGGNYTQAWKMATSTLSQTWRYTQVNGKTQVMQNLPPVDDKDIRFVLNAQFQRREYGKPTLTPMLLPTAETDRAIRAGAQAIPYQVYHIDESTGQLQTSATPNVPSIWWYNPKTFVAEAASAKIGAAKDEQNKRKALVPDQPPVMNVLGL